MSKDAQKIVDELIDQLVPRHMPKGEITALGIAAGIDPGTLRKIRSRKSLSAHTLISLMVARGVSPQNLQKLPYSKATKISKALTGWNILGSEMSDKQRIQFTKLVQYLLSEWKLRR